MLTKHTYYSLSHTHTYKSVTGQSKILIFCPIISQVFPTSSIRVYQSFTYKAECACPTLILDLIMQGQGTSPDTVQEQSTQKNYTNKVV